MDWAARSRLIDYLPGGQTLTMPAGVFSPVVSADVVQQYALGHDVAEMTPRHDVQWWRRADLGTYLPCGPPKVMLLVRRPLSR